MTSYIRHWKVGSTAEWRGPFGGFNYSPNKVTGWSARGITCGSVVCMCVVKVTMANVPA